MHEVFVRYSRMAFFMINLQDLYKWCAVPVDELERREGLKIRLRIVPDSKTMGELMAGEFVAEITAANGEGRELRAIVPCGPSAWYAPFVRMVNEKRVSLKNLHVFHMDECLNWQGGLLAVNDPYNFKTQMLRHFYSGVDPLLAVPESHRHFLEPVNMEFIREEIWRAPVDITLGGWGQDGHIAYNQARRHPYSPITLEQLRNASVRIQENNYDTILALAHRTLGAAYQFVPPMSITLGVKECLSAKKVRVFSDTGAWKQTALRVALFSPPDAEYPLTLLQEHGDAIITATRETAAHPISEHPEWEFETGDGSLSR